MTVVKGTRLVSNSEMQSFKWCRRNWYLAWYRGLRPRGRVVRSAASTGTRIHEALAAYYVSAGVECVHPLVTLRVIQARDAVLLTDAGDSEDGQRGLSDAEARLNSDFQLEQRMIEGYLEWLEETGADSEWEVIGSEEYVEVDFTDFTNRFGTPVKLIGKLDARLRNRHTGRVRFIDHKTVATLDQPLLGLNQQMLHYQLIGHLSGWDRIAGGIYNMLRKVKRTRASRPPYYGRQVVDHTLTELQSYAAKLRGTIADVADVEEHLRDGISHQVVAYPTPNRDCTWRCPFLRICRMHDDGSRVDAAVNDLYEIGNPLDYYGGMEKVEE